MEYSPNKMQRKLSSSKFNFKKKFGQNFIVDENIINSIVEKSHIDKETMVIEIGPGSGALTYKLANVSKNVLCYEIDKTLEVILSDNLKEHHNVDIIYDDFLKRNILSDIAKYDYKKLYVVANLPYYITTPIIIKFIDENIDIDKMIVMVQKEVGDRFKALPGCKDYNSLSIFLQYNYFIKKVMNVSKNVFLPKPNVDSIVVEFAKREKIKILDENLFYKLVRDSFRHKRKTLKNNLNDYDLEKIEYVLKLHKMDLSVRAENISMDIFIEIVNHITKKK